MGRFLAGTFFLCEFRARKQKLLLAQRRKNRKALCFNQNKLTSKKTSRLSGFARDFSERSPFHRFLYFFALFAAYFSDFWNPSEKK